MNKLNAKKQGDVKMARTKMSKTAKVRNLFAKGNSVTWKTLRNTFDLKSPAAMVGKLKSRNTIKSCYRSWSNCFVWFTRLRCISITL